MTSKLLDSSSKYPKSIVAKAILLTRRPDRPRCAYVMPPLMFGSVRMFRLATIRSGGRNRHGGDRIQSSA